MKIQQFTNETKYTSILLQYTVISYIGTIDSYFLIYLAF